MPKLKPTKPRLRPIAKRKPMRSLFVYGTLIREEIQLSVLGRVCSLTPARLEGFEVRQGRWPYLVAQPGALTEGFLMADLSDADLVKLDAYERVDAPGVDPDIYERRRMTVRGGGGEAVSCWVYLPILSKWPSDWLENRHA